MGMLLMAKAPCHDATCLVTIGRMQGSATDIAAFDRGAREAAQGRGFRIRELRTELTQVNGHAALYSKMTMEAETGAAHSITYVVGAGDSTYEFSFAATNDADVLDVATRTMGTFEGAPAKVRSPAFELGYFLGKVGMLGLVAAVVIMGSVFAARQSKARRRAIGR
jgi:hypothetical protein